ncbi:MAG: hypothetical protein U9Q77_01220 [Candidatus Marinimicrobia bacterium]|nr:hypothetical protein [Candidatus Neomarinimicrobiota bacterium]
MEKEKHLDQVLTRINDMRGFFKFGDEVIPFLGDLFSFLKGIMPLMSEMNNSLQDSAHKIPTASDRIDDVTRATEYATVEILDALDKISATLEILPELAKDNQTKSINMMHEEVANIVNALQFQDITSQKLAHANKILGAIYDKFTVLFASLEEAKMSTSIGKKVLEAIEEQVDPDARQREKDALDAETRDDIHHEAISQDDIDSMFG